MDFSMILILIGCVAFVVAGFGIGRKIFFPAIGLMVICFVVAFAITIANCKP